MRQLKHHCGQVLDLTYVSRPVLNKAGTEMLSSEPALSCPEHGIVTDLTEVRPRGSMCVVREER